MTNLTCWLLRRRLGAYRDGELSPAARARTEAHLARCGRCAAELATLGRLAAALAIDLPEPPAAVWEAFWPGVRARLAVADVEPEPEPAPRRLWAPVLARPALAFGSAIAVAAVAVLALFGPWSATPVPEAPRLVQPSTAQAPTGVAPGGVVPVSFPPVVVQSVETAPDSSAMVFTNPESDVTVVWVFGLDRTEL